ncbi:MAG: TorF family putative porin [Micavibrio sp.]|nr:TorF family putative porin [Micavibrio sp.]
MKTKLTLGVAALALGGVLSPSIANAAAQDYGLEYSANVGFYSEYSFRGIAQSDEHPAIQGGFDVSHDSGLYAGIWGSNVDFNDGSEANLETDIYAGYSGSVNNFSYDLGVIYYAYPGANRSLNYDFVEFSAAAGYDFDVFSTSVAFNYSPEYFGDSGNALYSAFAVDVPLPSDFTLSAHVGHQSIQDNTAFGVPDYTDWSVGLGYNLGGFDLSLAYIDTDLDEPGECADGCDGRVIFGISKSF